MRRARRASYAFLYTTNGHSQHQSESKLSPETIIMKIGLQLWIPYIFKVQHTVTCVRYRVSEAWVSSCAQKSSILSMASLPNVTSLHKVFFLWFSLLSIWFSHARLSRLTWVLREVSTLDILRDYLKSFSTWIWRLTRTVSEVSKIFFFPKFVHLHKKLLRTWSFLKFYSFTEFSLTWESKRYFRHWRMSWLFASIVSAKFS